MLISRIHVFLNNTGKNLFYVYSETITLSSCTIDFDKSAVSGSVVINTNTKTSFINKIKHIETANCFAKYDSFGSLTVVPDKEEKSRPRKRTLISSFFNETRL